MFHGSMVALVTPMTDTGEIDIPCFRRLLEIHLDQGTDAIVVNGTTGESSTLTANEKLQAIKIALETVAGQIPIIAGTGTYSTLETIRSTRDAMELGVDACLVVTPYYNRPTQEGLYEHYKALSEAVPLPIVMYNVPGRTGCDLLPETVEKLSRFSNMQRAKHSNKIKSSPYAVVSIKPFVIEAGGLLVLLYSPIQQNIVLRKYSLPFQAQSMAFYVSMPLEQMAIL